MSTIIDISTANGVLAALKRTYQEGEPMSQFPEETYYTRAMKPKRRSIGAGLYDDIQTKQNQSYGLRNNGSNDNQDMPESLAAVFQAANWDMARGYLRLVLTGKAANRALSGGEKASFIRNLAFLQSDIENAWAKHLEFSLLNTPSATGSYSGVCGVLNNAGYVAADAVTFTLDITTNATCRRYKLFQGIQDGQKLDVFRVSTGAVVASIIVDTVSLSAGTFTGSLSADIAATSNEFYLVNQGDFNQDVNGLGAILDDGTYTSTLGGVTTGGQWVGTELDGSGTLRDFAPDFMDRASLTAIKANGGKPTQAWMSFGMKQQLMAYIQRVVQINAPSGGKSPIKVNPAGDVDSWGPNASIHTSAYMPAHEIFIIQPEGILIEEQEPLHPVMVSGSSERPNFWQKLPGKDTWEATLVHEVQQRTRRRNVHVKISDLNQPTF